MVGTNTACSSDEETGIGCCGVGLTSCDAFV